MTWEQFVQFLVRDETAVVVAVILSVLSEYSEYYEGLKAKVKRLVFYGLAFAVPMLGAVLGMATLDWPVSWAETFWPAIVTGFLASGIGTLVHTRSLKSE
jgi:hypothetical protein